jgi:hypothetical protein
VDEGVIWESLWGVKGLSLVSIEVFGKLITVYNSENSSIDIEVASEVEVSPVIELGLIFWKRKLVSLEEDSLWNSRVLYSTFDDVDGVVIQVVHDDAFSNSVIFIWVLNNWLLEKTIEFQDLSVVLQPLGSDFGDSIVFLWLPLRYAGKSEWESVLHGIKQRGINFLLQTSCLLYTTNTRMRNGEMGVTYRTWCCP